MEGECLTKCIYCGHMLVWENDFDSEDYGIEREGIVGIWHCPNCGAEYEVFVPNNPNEEE